ncbi:hypothetical protein [Geobacter sp. SVR]|uniref:enoyl ACP reductase FabMG family protein n=1 Tax=Geobacter sp. SVR TaxID=2495594 RepID=UPI00143EFF93|nr:hypothetical protein [Geobacter sp. SVR]BCS55142.1 hypothetical protein GSVR_34500 [Geobacter sp. SVR]GCF85323.1 hypothetical protein GSbR_19230 [Geobacter sp. SVR]
MTDYRPMQELPGKAGYKTGDVLVLVGELFGRGYANGMVDEARRLGMTVIGTTVGRRDADGSLRPLNAEELRAAEAILGGKIINVPLEAGFDMEAVNGQPSVAEQLKKARPDDWNTITFPEGFIEQARAAGTARFRSALSMVAAELGRQIPEGASVVFAHAMAGGIPRARVFMPLLNRVFKGTGDKFLASADFWQSNLGRLCDASFNEVTADTFRYLLEETAAIRTRNTTAGGRVSYTAYGYHGTGVLVGGEYRWQSYTPYVQGWAKMRLEQIAAEAFDQGIVATVFNCPEIQTNSSALFLGVEISLYPLLTAIRREAGEALAAPLYERCRQMLKEGETLERLLERADAYLSSPLLSELLDFAAWPQHNTGAQAEFMLAASAELMGMHADQKQLVCAELSRVVFLATGRLMVQAAWQPAGPVVWLNHDTIGQLLSGPMGAGIL